MELIRVENLCKSFSGVPVLENLNFTVEKGDSLYVVGENGSGKTTLIKILLGLKKQTSGSIKFVLNQSKIGYLPQISDIQADFPATVKEVVMSGFLNRKALSPFYSAEQKKKAAKIMERLELTDIKNCSFRSLSGGQKQRTLLCRALCAADGILLLDEPTNALDPLAVAEFYEIIEHLCKEGMTLIMISHDVSCAVHHGNKILHLGKDGYFFGTSKEYISSPQGKKMLTEGHHHD
ncbi:MAG: ABC transporter ATP-binding protein [Clostridiales bacterium]|nr:ABC transporter ATP-binding protein [Candidatus Equinaster intestinalis]